MATLGPVPTYTSSQAVHLQRLECGVNVLPESNTLAYSATIFITFVPAGPEDFHVLRKLK